MYFTRKLTLSLCLTTLLLIGSTAVASAHQPYFEGDDWTARKPWTVKDPDRLHGALRHAGPLRRRGLRDLHRQEGSVHARGRHDPANRWPGRICADRGGDRPRPARDVTSDSGDSAAPGGGCGAGADSQPCAHVFEPLSRTSYWEAPRTA